MAVATQAAVIIIPIYKTRQPDAETAVISLRLRAIIDVIRQIRKSAAIEAMQATEALTYAQVAGLTTHVGRRIGLTTD